MGPRLDPGQADPANGLPIPIPIDIEDLFPVDVGIIGCCDWAIIGGDAIPMPMLIPIDCLFPVDMGDMPCAIPENWPDIARCGCG